MTVVKNELNAYLAETIKVWPEVSKIISTLYSEDQYNNAVTLLDELIDQVNNKKSPVIESLIDTLGTLIKDYEDRNVDEPDADPAGNLRYLMQEHHVKQSDLHEIGSQGVVSEILNGRRKLNVRQIQLLSNLFHVSPTVFI